MKLKNILCFLLACLLLSACSSEVVRCNLYTPTVDPNVFYSTIVIDADELNCLVAFSDIKTVPVGTLIKAQVTVTSLAPYTQNLEYKVVWFDKNGMEIDASGQSWKPFVLNNKETKGIQAVATNPGAKSFKFQLKTVM